MRQTFELYRRTGAKRKGMAALDSAEYQGRNVLSLQKAVSRSRSDAPRETLSQTFRGCVFEPVDSCSKTYTNFQQLTRTSPACSAPFRGYRACSIWNSPKVITTFNIQLLTVELFLIPSSKHNDQHSCARSSYIRGRLMVAGLGTNWNIGFLETTRFSESSEVSGFF